MVSRPAADRQGKVLALIHHCLKVSGAKAAVRKKKHGGGSKGNAL